ncbi:MAG: hypothetical protein LUF92_07170 [Clostridiales bacterium]|nr:hypothetical protein [Clostridiales bacterium]
MRTFKFEDLTFRGTVEFRSVCCQPVSDCMTVAAFHVGLKQKLYELNALLENDHVIFHHGYNRGELRKLFVKKNLPGFVDEDEVYALTRRILLLAREGLCERGFGEEIFLDSLFERVEVRENPSQRLLRMRQEGVSLEDIILQYGKLPQSAGRI